MPQLMKRPNSCSGPDCPGCSSANCMAEGGKVKGVHEADDETKGKSMAGIFARHAKDPGEVGAGSKRLAIGEHQKVLSDLKSMPKPKLYASGGAVKGVNKETTLKGRSEAGVKLKPAFSVFGKESDTENSKDSHRKTLGEIKDMKSQDRTNLAEGGEASDHDDDMHEMLGHELMEAFDKKDKKGIMSAIEACVMRRMSKE